MCWNKEAEEALKRRAEKNIPWPKNKLRCKGCSTEGTSQYNPLFCDECIRSAFDVVGGISG